MISLVTYKLLHLIGVFGVLMALSGVLFYVDSGGRKDTFAGRRLIGILHGLGLLIIVVSGFGMLARLGMTEGVPGYIWAKLVIWLALGGVIALPYRKPDLARPAAYTVLALAILSAYLGLYKPF